jgi:ubiquilin
MVVQVLRQSMEMMRNPNAMREAMRSQDLQMSQLENIPGGFNAMRRMFEDVQEPMMEASQSMGAAQQNNNTNNANSTSSTPSTAPTNTALPNPWGGGAPANNSIAQPQGFGNPFGQAGAGGFNPLGGMGGMGGMGKCHLLVFSKV